MIAPRYTVVWGELLATEFTNRWIDGDSEERAVLTQIAATIDRDLAMGAAVLGEALLSETQVRVWQLPGFMPPVSVTYQVFPADRTVRIISISIRK
jgi:hypothetical protein